jgi:uncharacterized membrane protein YgcG
LFLVPELPEGYYNLELNADQHTPFRCTVFIEPGITNEVLAFLSYQTVRYTWTVERIEIEDRYKITIETEFEANVPAPVVTIEPAVLDVRDLMVIGQVKQVNMTIRNHGLIAVDNTRLRFGTHPFYSIEPLIGDLGRLDAKSSLTIPVTLRRIATFESLAQGITPASGSVPCGMGGDLSFEFECGPLKISGGSSVGVSGVQGDCGGGPSIGSGGGGVGGGGGGGGRGGRRRCQPRLQQPCHWRENRLRPDVSRVGGPGLHPGSGGLFLWRCRLRQRTGRRWGAGN